MEKMNAVIIDARCAAMLRVRMNVKPTRRAAALSPLSKALRAGRKASRVLVASAAGCT